MSYYPFVITTASANTGLYTLSLHDALPISICFRKGAPLWFVPRTSLRIAKGEDALSTYTFNKHVIKHRFCPKCGRSEEHTSELQSQSNLVCRLLLEKKKIIHHTDLHLSSGV